MFDIIQKQILAQDIKRIDVLAPDIARKALAGHFAMVTVKEGLEPFPLALVDSDERKGHVSFIVHEVGLRTRALSELSIGQKLQRVIGPLGQSAFIDKFGVVICVATGIGAAQILPICRSLKKKGNKVIGIIGAKSKNVLMLESQMRVVCDELFITTNDGSYERKGLATQMLKDMLERFSVNAVYAIGSVDMMQSASEMAKAKGIPIYVTVHTMTLCGVGICASCRIKNGANLSLSCCDGPHFNGADVDFDDLHIRSQVLKDVTCLPKTKQIQIPSALGWLNPIAAWIQQ